MNSTRLAGVAAAIAVSTIPLHANAGILVLAERNGPEFIDGMPGLYASKGPTSWVVYGMPGTEVTAPADGPLAAVTINVRGHGPIPLVGDPEPNAVNWGGFVYRIHVWNCGVLTPGESCSTYEADPTGGGIGGFTPTNLDNLEPTGQYVPDGWEGDPFLLYDLVFDVTTAGYAIDADHTYVIGFVAEGLEDYGTVYQSLSDWSGPPPVSDYYANDTVPADRLIDHGVSPPWVGSRITMIVPHPVCGDGLCEGEEATTCPEDCSGVPAMSTWGMIAMTLLVLTAGTLICARRDGWLSVR